MPCDWRQGFTPEQYEQRTGLAFSNLAKQVELLQQQQLLTTEGGLVRTTDKGYQFLNSVLEAFL